MKTSCKSIFNRISVGALVLALVGSAVNVIPVSAASIVVNTNADGAPADDGLCTLREALLAAQTNLAHYGCTAGSPVAADTISFAAGYIITLSPIQKQLPVQSEVIIQGKGKDNTVIQAAPQQNLATYRVFDVDPLGKLTLEKVTVRHGRCNGSCSIIGGTHQGGAIYNQGVLTVKDSDVSENTTDASGGAIYNAGQATLTVVNTWFDKNATTGSQGGAVFNDGTMTVAVGYFLQNSAAAYGSGIYNGGNLMISSSTFSENSAQETGGAIYNAGILAVTDSTFCRNKADDGGGGIYNEGTLSVSNTTFSGNNGRDGGGLHIHTQRAVLLRVRNSTFSGNTANRGGGIYVDGDVDATLNLLNSTLAGNTGSDGGGGIHRATLAAGQVTLRNTMVANNNVISSGGANCAGTITNGGNNLDSGATCGWGSNNGSLSNTNPKISALADNLGPTKTIALQYGSPAIDAGKDLDCPATDQRGVSRPQGSKCDIGAFEFDHTFHDVERTHWAWSYVERLVAAGITGGCSAGSSMYCPGNTVNRAQMAIFLLRGIHGSSYTPPDVNGDSGFSDVPADSSSASWIKELAAEGITGGCGGGNYCPSAPVSRAQMAIFLLRAEHGASYVPPDVNGDSGFLDIAPSSATAPWIKQLVAEGISAGCGNGNYCPNNSVTRDQMAVFLVRTFNLP